MPPTRVSCAVVQRADVDDAATDHLEEQLQVRRHAGDADLRGEHVGVEPGLGRLGRRPVGHRRAARVAETEAAHDGRRDVGRAEWSVGVRGPYVVLDLLHEGREHRAGDVEHHPEDEELTDDAGELFGRHAELGHQWHEFGRHRRHVTDALEDRVHQRGGVLFEAVEELALCTRPPT